MFAKIPSLSVDTSYKIVVPFYVYGAICLVATGFFLLFCGESFLSDYWNPRLLSITHIMALGWGTMLIFGSGHQLIPVLLKYPLYSYKLARSTFLFMAIGIPLLCYGFYTFDMGNISKWGGRFVLTGMILFLINITMTFLKSKSYTIHGIYFLASAIWLFITGAGGLSCVYNFTFPLFENNSFHYLILHAHAGLAGWFLLLIIGVGSKLIPMFLISKYSNNILLWIIFAFINIGLVSMIIIFYWFNTSAFFLIPILLIFISIVLFLYFLYMSYKKRIRKKIDGQMKISFFSILMLIIPIFILGSFIVYQIVMQKNLYSLIIVYGFLLFFGWITSLILGMTFKTLPFIIWNKVYHGKALVGKTPNFKNLFNHKIFTLTSLFYIVGIGLFCVGIICTQLILLNIGALFFLVCATLYNWNILKIIFHKSTI